MAFHSAEKIAITAYEDLMKKNPSELDDARALRELKGHHNFPNHVLLHTAFCFLRAGSLEEAEKKIASERGIESNAAKMSLKDALDFIGQVKDRASMESRGCIFVSGHYYPARENMEQGTLFHSARRQIIPAYAPVMDAALASMYSRKSLVTAPTLQEMPFIAAQLMPQGTERDFIWNALSEQTGQKEFAATLASSAKVANVFANIVGIIIPRAQWVLPSETASQQSVPKSEAPKPEKDQSLLKELRTLIEGREIALLEAQIYLYTSSPIDGDYPTFEEASTKFNITSENIRITVDYVDEQLLLLRHGELEINRHKTPSVRPK